jgi:uncharacterized protein (TIRG00374 family)
MNKTLRMAIGLLVSAVCLWLVFRNVSFHEVAQAVRQSKKIWFLAIFFCIVTTHILRTFRWRVLLSPVKVVPPVPLFILLTFGFFMNNVLPARAGEFLRAYAADREMGIPTSTALGSIALERLSDLAGLLLVLVIASTVLPADKIPFEKIGLVIAIGLIGTLALFLFFQKRKKIPGALPRPVEWAFSFLQNLTRGFAALKSPSKMISVLLLSFSVWFFEIINVVLIGRAFSVELPFSHAASVLTGIAVGVMIPAAPGFIGTYEFFGQQPLLLLGYPAGLSFSLIFVLHVFILIINSLLGLPGFFKVGWGPRR